MSRSYVDSTSGVASRPHSPPVYNRDNLPPYEKMFLSDVWDVRDLPGARFTPGGSGFTTKFHEVPLSFRDDVKKYCRIKTTELSWQSIRVADNCITEFCRFMAENTSNKTTFAGLARADIEAFMIYLSRRMSKVSGRRRRAGTLSPAVQWRMMCNARRFLQYLVRTDADIAPVKPLNQIFWPEDAKIAGPQYGLAPLAEDKLIPEEVLAQMDECLDKLPEMYLPIVVIQRASGWRISDVLNLKLDTALSVTKAPLDPSEARFWLVGDISKTRVENHRVPIEKAVADVILEQIRTTRLMYTDALNPNGWLFPSPENSRIGHPISSLAVSDALNAFAKKCEIRDKDGKIFAFRTHSFRHTKAIELINNKMALTHVQKWLAHASPEMTLRYAKISDNTLHDAWMKTLESGAVVLKDGIPTKITGEEIMSDPHIEWERIRQGLDAVALPNGYCMKSSKQNCPAAAIPCYTCSNFCTTPKHLTQFVEHRDRIKEMIAIGEATGNKQWVERNQQQIIPIQNIITVLESGNVHHLSGKAIREEVNNG